MNQFQYQPMEKTNQRIRSSSNVGGNINKNHFQPLHFPQMEDPNNMSMNLMNPMSINQNQYIAPNPNINQHINENYNQMPMHPMNHNFHNYNFNPNNDLTTQNNSMPSNQANFNNPPEFAHSNQNLTTPNNVGLSISYKNYQIDGDQKNQKKLEYGNDLRRQMEEDRKKKELQKEQRKREEWEEEMRVQREFELMKLQEEKEKDKKKMDMDRLNNENQALRDQYVMVKNKGKNIEEKKNSNFENSNNDDNPNNANYNAGQNNPHQNQNFQNNFQDEKAHQEDVELRVGINNEIMRLRNNLVEQQNILLNQINDLKTETQNANLQKYEVMKEFDVLKEELARQRADEEMRRKYVYDVIVDNNNKVTNIYSNSRLPDIDQEDFKVEFPKAKNHRKNVKNLHYEDTIKYPNRIPAIPNLDELNEQPIKATSRFIDVDTHNVIDSLNIYEPKKKDIEVDKARSKGYELNEDFGALRSYYKGREISPNIDNDLNKYFRSLKTQKPIENHNLFLTDHRSKQRANRTPDTSRTPVKTPNLNEKEKENFDRFIKNDLEYNKQILNDDTLSINQIYNKNLERLRFLNNFEDNIPSFNTNELHKLENIIDNYKGNGAHKDNFVENSKLKKQPENFDDFLNKLNNIRSSKFEENEYSY